MTRPNKSEKKQAPARKASNTKHKSGGGSKVRSGSKGGAKSPVLLVLAQLYSSGNTKPDRSLVSSLTRYPEKSLGTTLLNIKKKDGHVVYDKDSVWLTKGGIEAATEQYGEDILKPLDNVATHQKLITLHHLTGSKLKIFNELLDGSAKTKEELMKAIECENAKSFGTYTSALKTSGLLEFVNEDKVKKFQLVEATCFPLGRPTSS